MSRQHGCEVAPPHEERKKKEERSRSRFCFYLDARSFSFSRPFPTEWIGRTQKFLPRVLHNHTEGTFLFFRLAASFFFFFFLPYNNHMVDDENNGT
jgi:hypothetical protein